MEIFWTDSKQSPIVLMFGLDPGTDVFGFVACFGVTVIVDECNQKWFMAVKGPRGALYLWVRDWDNLCVVA